MANTQFLGPVFSNNGFRVGSYSSDTIGTPLAKVQGVQTQTISVTAVANTDTTVTIPAAAIVSKFIVYTTTAFGAATDATISLGNAAGGAQYVAATSIKAGGVVILTAAASVAAASGLLSFPGTLYIRIVQTGAASATGAATLVIEYAV